jgi:CHAT domain-containing protein
VVRRAGPVRRQELGRADDLRDSLNRWAAHDCPLPEPRRADEKGAPIGPAAHGGGRLGGFEALDEARVVRLARLVEEETRDADLILVAPDGFLASTPFAALPLLQHGRRLIDRAPIVIYPVPGRLAHERSGAHPGPALRPRLLLVGSADYEDAATRLDDLPKVTPKRGGKFRPLPGIQEEVQAVSQVFQQVHGRGVWALDAGSATKAHVRRQASGFEYVHISTQGGVCDFVGAGSERETGFEPSPFIALTGANRPQSAGEGGILTALEVAEWDLDRTELVVLSACNTAAGGGVGGDVTLGLHRAFLAAGARSVVAATHNAGDDETAALMTRFYQNLWVHKMSRAEAFRQAQLFIRHQHVPTFERPGPPAGPRENPPKMWALFALYGDWGHAG